MVKVTILGCGCAEGVPMIGCSCEVCLSKNTKNKRTRQSIYIESLTTKLLVDAGPDIRSQCLANKIINLDGLLVTHPHADHIGGLADLRAFCISSHKTINLFSDKKCLDEIKTRFNYLFRDCAIGANIKKPILKANTLKLWVKNKIGDIEFIPFIQDHVRITSLGFLFKDFAYSTDFKSLNQRSIDLLKNIPLWIVECISYKRNYSAHVNLEEMLRFYEQVNPQRAIIIHMSHEIDYVKFKRMLPKNVEIAYDGMQHIVS
ncbi:MAG: MBL fold metallo-hydrolase [Rickettsiales bacterium]|nr:MBL fold metallo-hydrolase [Rickettsiales bacterium]